MCVCSDVCDAERVGMIWCTQTLLPPSETTESSPLENCCLRSSCHARETLMEKFPYGFKLGFVVQTFHLN